MREGGVRGRGRGREGDGGREEIGERLHAHACVYCLT